MGSYAQHGWRQSPEGTDPTFTGRWHVTGATDEPPFDPDSVGLTGFLWFKLAVGPPEHPLQSTELLWSVAGGGDGDVICTLPAAYIQFALGQNIPLNGQDGAGGFRAGYLNGVSGDVVIGPPP